MKRKCMICAKLKLVYKIINDFINKAEVFRVVCVYYFLYDNDKYFARGIEDICDKNGGRGL